MEISFFLGANSKDGFYSLYEGFASKEKDFLHIIKGGPGTGKSGFMRRLGREAHSRGFDVHYVLCSGDPKSLDGLYIPALHQAWVDGTAPHVLEPRRFGVDGDYVNLGDYCSLPLSEDELCYVNLITDEYKSAYKHAYAYLNCIPKLKTAYLPVLFDERVCEAVKKRVNGILSRYSQNIAHCQSLCESCFLSAISCQGHVRLNDSVSILCKLVYAFDSDVDFNGMALDIAVNAARERNLKTILCPSPADPTVLEAVLLPELSLGFVCGDWELPSVRHIRTSAMLPPELLRSARPDIRRGRELEREILSRAVEQLAAAKALHDRLESVYISHMDFKSLDKFTDEQIKKVFG